MMSLSQVPSASTSLVSRPALVQDGATRQQISPRAVDPTTAVSKERSNAALDTSRRQGESVQVVWSAQVSDEARAALTDVVDRNAVKESRQVPLEKPPAKKSEVQVALEKQLNELLETVWKASARAVDFLLQRELTKASADTSAVEADALAQDVGGSLTEAGYVSGGRSKLRADSVQTYTTKGMAETLRAESEKGRIVDAVA